MKISAISNALNSFSNNNTVRNSVNKQNVSFKGVYVEDIVDLGNVAEQGMPARFFKRDALLLNEIASRYPNQDCFIRKGHGGMPRLEYREKPPVVQNFSSSLAGQYNMSINPDDSEYPTTELLLENDDSPINRMIGLTSYISLNPSLPFTVKAGYELHKRLIAKKMEIMEQIGKNDGFSLGQKTLTERAREEIALEESAVKRLLLESAYSSLTDKATASQIYGSDIPKVQSSLEAKRTYDLTTSLAKQSQVKADGNNEDFDIVEFAVGQYPDYEDNIEKNKQIVSYMANNGYVIG